MKYLDDFLKKQEQGSPSRTAVEVVACPVENTNNLQNKKRKITAESNVEGALSAVVLSPCPALGDGWTQKLVPRGNTRTAAADRYFVSPEGATFRSMRAVRRHLEAREGAMNSDKNAVTELVQPAAMVNNPSEYEETTHNDIHAASLVFCERLEEFRAATMRDFNQQATKHCHLGQENEVLKAELKKEKKSSELLQSKIAALTQMNEKNRALKAELQNEKKSNEALTFKIADLTRQNELLKLDLNTERRARKDFLEKDAEIRRMKAEIESLQRESIQNKEKLARHKEALMRNLSEL